MMTLRVGKPWWIVGVVVGPVMIVLGVALARAGLDDADRWASVIGVFMNISGLGLTVYGTIQTRRDDTSEYGHADTVRNTVTDAEVGGPALLGRDMWSEKLTGFPLSAPTIADRPDEPRRATDRKSAAVENRVEGGTFRGPLIMGRDLSNITLSPPPSPDKQGEDRTGR